MMRAVHGSTVLYPADGNATAALTKAMADLPGIVYLRTTREKTAKLYDADEAFPVGGSKIAALERRGPRDAGERRRHAVRVADGRGRAGRRGHRVPRDRRLLDQADRRRDAADGAGRDRADRDRRGPPGWRAASATRCWRRSPRAARTCRAASSRSASPRCRGRARRRSCASGPASRRRRSRTASAPRWPDQAPAGSGGMATGAGIGSGRVNAGAARVRQAMTAAVAARQAEPA